MQSFKRDIINEMIRTGNKYDYSKMADAVGCGEATSTHHLLDLCREGICKRVRIGRKYWYCVGITPADVANELVNIRIIVKNMAKEVNEADKRHEIQSKEFTAIQMELGELRRENNLLHGEIHRIRENRFWNGDLDTSTHNQGPETIGKESAA